MPAALAANYEHLVESVPELAEGHVHFTARSITGKVMRVWMEVEAARRMCADLANVIGEYDLQEIAADRHVRS